MALKNHVYFKKRAEHMILLEKVKFFSMLGQIL